MTGIVTDQHLRVLELFAGMGGCAAALGQQASVVAAVDISALAFAVYRRNFAHPTFCRTIESLPASELAAWNADLWWLSPPCQPYTRKGKQRDLDDPRAAALLRIVENIEIIRPPVIALENVPPFGESQTRAKLMAVLERCGYHSREQLLCPSELGVPNRRRRYYLLASRRELPPSISAKHAHRPLSTFVDRACDDEVQLQLDPVVAQQYSGAIDVVDADDPQAMTSCFAAAYGNSVVRSGSYLRTPRGLRRFAPEEVQRLLGFPPSFAWPNTFSREQKWRLLGNSLSLWTVREVLAPLLTGPSVG